MAKYYNLTKGPLNLPLRSGKSASVPPKSWVDIDREDEGSERIITYIRKGFLKRQAAQPVPPPPPAKSVEAPKATEAPKAEQIVTPEAEVVSKEQPEAEAPEEASESTELELKRRSKKGRRKFNA